MGQWSSSPNVKARFVHNHLYCLLLVYNTHSSLSMQHQLVKHGSCSASSNSLENMSNDNDSINQSIRVFYIALIKLSNWTHYNLLNSPFNYFYSTTWTKAWLCMLCSVIIPIDWYTQFTDAPHSLTV